MRGLSGNWTIAMFAVGALAAACSGQVVHQTERPDASNGGAGGRSSFGNGGSTGGGAVPGCVDFSTLPTAPISFRRDVMPIFGLSCIASSCHDSNARKADLVLGDPSACGPAGTVCYDPTARWYYTYRAGVPPDLLTAVYSGLVNVPSKIVPAVNLVTPGDPSSSFLLDTLIGTQNTSWYSSQCRSTEPSLPGAPCGPDMPLGSPNWCEGGDQLSVEKVQALAMWIQQGAPMN
jgi:hypothetical protein